MGAVEVTLLEGDLAAGCLYIALGCLRPALPLYRESDTSIINTPHRSFVQVQVISRPIHRLA